MILLNQENSTETQKLHFFTDSAGGLCSDSKELPFVLCPMKHDEQTDEKYDEVNRLAVEFAESCEE